MSSLLQRLTKVYNEYKDDYNPAQFKAAAADACKGVKAEKKMQNKLQPSGDGVLPSSKKPSAYNNHMASFISKYIQEHPDETPREAMKAGAFSWKNGGKDGWTNQGS